MTTPATILRLNNRFRAIAPPIISARSVLMMANSERTYKGHLNLFGRCSLQFCAKSFPVTLPSLQARDWRKQAKTFDMRMMQSNLYWN